MHIYLKDFGSADLIKHFFTDSHIISIGVVEDFPNFKMAAITAKKLIDADYKALVHISNSKRGFLICRTLLHLIFSFYDL